MKSFHLTVWTIITLFVLIMGGVAGTAYRQKDKLLQAMIQQTWAFWREMAQK